MLWCYNFILLTLYSNHLNKILMLSICNFNIHNNRLPEDVV